LRITKVFVFQICTLCIMYPAADCEVRHIVTLFLCTVQKYNRMARHLSQLALTELRNQRAPHV